MKGDDPNTPFPEAVAMACFMAIGVYNVIELLVSVFVTFKRHSGLYFWSILIATIGIFIYSVGFTLKFFVTHVKYVNYIGLMFAIIGWPAMITGQSLALYSRLHLLMRDEQKLRWIFRMIVANGVVFHGLIIGVSFPAETSLTMAKAYSASEKIQVTVFSIQEAIISGLYIWHTYTFLKPTSSLQGKRIHGIRRHLIYVNIIVIVMDATLLGTEYANQYKIQTTYKALVYSVKLKLEFSVLNKLLSVTRRNGTGPCKGSCPKASVCCGTFWSGVGTEIGSRVVHMNNSLMGTGANMGYAVTATATANCASNNDLSIELDETGVKKTTVVYIESHSREITETDESQRVESSKASSEIHFAEAGC